MVEEDGDGGAVVKYGGSRQLDFEKLESYNITVRATVRAGMAGVGRELVGGCVCVGGG